MVIRVGGVLLLGSNGELFELTFFLIRVHELVYIL
jgi:hypothetical protein